MDRQLCLWDASENYSAVTRGGAKQIPFHSRLRKGQRQGHWIQKEICLLHVQSQCGHTFWDACSKRVQILRSRCEKYNWGFIPWFYWSFIELCCESHTISTDKQTNRSQISFAELNKETYSYKGKGKLKCGIYILNLPVAPAKSSGSSPSSVSRFPMKSTSFSPDLCKHIQTKMCSVIMQI